MRPKYIQAIHYLENGVGTQTYLNPVQNFAKHVGQEYINSDYDIYSSVGQNSLLVMFYEGTSPEARGELAWWLWRDYKDTQSNKYWLRIRSLWEWRMQKAAVAAYSNTFEKEMRWLAQFPEAAPDHETIESMWSLIIDLLPYITRSEDFYDSGWDAIEKFLAKEVARSPKQIAHFYRLMYERRSKGRYFSNPPEVKTIIETAAQNDEAKQEVLDLLDMMGRRGIHNYKELYDELSGFN